MAQQQWYCHGHHRWMSFTVRRVDPHRIGYPSVSHDTGSNIRTVSMFPHFQKPMDDQSRWCVPTHAFILLLTSCMCLSTLLSQFLVIHPSPSVHLLCRLYLCLPPIPMPIPIPTAPLHLVYVNVNVHFYFLFDFYFSFLLFYYLMGWMLWLRWHDMNYINQ